MSWQLNFCQVRKSLLPQNGVRRKTVCLSPRKTANPLSVCHSHSSSSVTVFPQCLSLCLTLLSQMPLLHKWTACMWQFSSYPGYSKQIQHSPIHTCSGTCSSLLVTDGTTLMLHTCSRTHITVVEDQIISTVQKEMCEKSLCIKLFSTTTLIPHLVPSHAKQFLKYSLSFPSLFFQYSPSILNDFSGDSDTRVLAYLNFTTTVTVNRNS